MATSHFSSSGGLSLDRIQVPGTQGMMPREFLIFHELTVSRELELWGTTDRCATLAEAAGFWRGNGYEERRVFLARSGGTVVGFGTLTLPLSENTTTAGVDVFVSRGSRRRGWGTAILSALEQLASHNGRTSFDAYTSGPHESAGSGLLEAASGAGGVPLDSPSTRFALHHGYSLEQVETNSMLGIPVPEELLQRLEAECILLTQGYSAVTWERRCPGELVDAFARLKSLMSTEVPIAGLGWEGEYWDAARVREEEDTWQDSGVDSLVAAVRHHATGELAAYTVLTHRAAVPAIIYQEDTLVAPGHRGHRLGMAVKIANLRRAGEVWPEAAAVLTWNANENQHMLAINIALGFKSSGFDGEWQKRVG